MGGAAASGGAAFGELLRQLRLEADLTQAQLAEQAGLSTRAIQHLEGGHGSPYAETTRRLAAALGLEGELRRTFGAAARRPSRPRQAAARRPSTRAVDGRGRHNLPVALTSFIGRQQETQAVRQRLATSRLLTLVGAGGCGKTRLALEVAAGLVEGYADGVWLVELAPLLEGRLVAERVAGVLGLGDVPGESIQHVLLQGLRDRELVLLLDNCEHVAEACASLTNAILLGCPGVRILATSRAVLGVQGEQVWRVPSLGLPDSARPATAAHVATSEAARLFVERVQATLADFAPSEQNAAAIAEVCARLDGLPLALELAAARVRGLGVRELAARLDDCFGLLRSTAVAGRPARQQTLQATIDWSYQLLDRRAQDVFARLSVMHGGCTLEAAEAVAGEPDGSLLEVLERLVDQSLVIAEPTADGALRYRLLEPLRQYGLERLQTAGLAEPMRTRHAHYFCQVLPRWWRPAWWGPDTDERLRHVDRELDNLRAALRWLIDRGETGPAQRVGWALAPYWLLRARIKEGRSWLGELVRLAEQTPDRAARAGVLVWCGGLATEDGDHATARTLLAPALGEARASGDALALAFALLWSALSAQYRHEPDQARTFAEEGVAVSRAGGQRGLEGMLLRILAQVDLERGALETAGCLAEQSLVACREAGHGPGVALALGVLGLVRFRRGEYPAARALLEESLAHTRTAGAPVIPLHTLVYLAWVLLEEGDLDGARRRATAALAVARGVLGGGAFLALPLEALAQLAIARGEAALGLQLAAAAATRRAAGAAPITPTQQQQLERWLARARAQLGPQLASAVELNGQALTDDQAVDRAR